MAIDTTEIRIGASGSVFVAPIGTAAPVDIATALNAAFIDLGAIDEDGVTLAPSQSVEKIRSWQSGKAVRVIKTEDELTLSFGLQQFNADTLPLALGGGTVTETLGPPAFYTYNPPAAGEVDERMFVVEWVDGIYTSRLFVPRGMVTETSDVQLTKSAEIKLALSVEVLGSSPDDFIIITDDPAFAA